MRHDGLVHAATAVLADGDWIWTPVCRPDEHYRLIRSRETTDIVTCLQCISTVSGRDL